MADKSKTSWAQLRVGILAMVALFLIVLMIFLLTGNTNWFTKESNLHTFLDDAASLTEGAPVRINGILAGKVKKVQLSGLNDPLRIIRVDFTVNQKLLKEIPVDSTIYIASDNVLGSTKFINVKKGDKRETVRDGAEIKAKDTREFDEVVQQGYAVLASLQGILGKVNDIVAQVEVGKGSIGKLLVDEELYNRLLAVVSEGQKITTALTTGKGTVGKLLYDPELYNDVRGSLAKVDTIVAGLQKGEGTAGKFLKDPSMYDDLHKSVDELKQILADLNAGKGTAGKLLKEDQIASQISTTLGKVDLTIDKINSGQGTIGQLLVNPQLYDAANGTTRELHDLLKDFRANPKKFLRIKLALF